MPVIESPLSVDRHLSDVGEGLHLMLVEPATGPSRDRLDALAARPSPQNASLTIGPEGGWSEDELSRAHAEGWELLTLGSRTLRADAAPVAAVSVLLFLWGEL